jgi:hypothetical protein
MLSAYYNKTATDAKLNLKVNISDTASMLSGYKTYYPRAALSFTAGSGAYNNSTGVITIPTNTNQLTNGAAFITGYTETDPVVKAINGIVKSNGTTISAATAGTDYQAPISLTTTGSNGAATFSSNTLNVPNYTLSGLGGQPQLNGTGFVKASGTTISYDNSTYLTTSSASSTYVPYSGATGAVNLGSNDFSSRYGFFYGNQTYYAQIGADQYGAYVQGYNGSTSKYQPIVFYGGSNTTSFTNLTLNNSGATFTGSMTASSLIKSGGTSSQFLMADGSVNSNTYLTTSSASSTYLPLTGGNLTNSGTNQTWIDFRNSGGDFYVGKESSVAGAYFTGSSAYANVFYSAQNIQTIVSGNRVIDVSSGGIAVTGTASFSSYVSGINFFSNNKSNTIDIGNVVNYPNYNFIGYGGYWGIRTDNSNGFNIDTYNNGTPKNVFNITQSGASTFSSSISVGGTGYFGSDVFTYNNGGIFFSGGGSYASGIFQNANGLNLQIGSAPKLTINSSGQVGIGTTNPAANLDIQAGRVANLTLLKIGTNNASTANGDQVNIDFYSYANNYLNGRISRVIEDYTTYAGALAFATGNSGSVTERLRITSNGTIGFSGSASPNNANLDKMSMGYLNSSYGWIQTWAGTPLTLNSQGNNVLIGTTTDAGYLLNVSGTGRFGSDAYNGDLTIISNATPFLMRGRSPYQAAGMVLTWDISPNVGIVAAPTIGFNTNATLGTNVGTRALTLASTGAASFSSTIQTGSGPTMSFVNKFAGTPSMPGNVLQVSIGGTNYYIQLYTTTL